MLKLKLTLTASLLLVAGLARADVAPPPGSSCEAQKVGEPCSFAGKEGRCEKDEHCSTPVGCDAGGQPCQPVCTQAVVCKECKECESGCALVPSAWRSPATLLPAILLLAIGLLFAARPRRR